MKKTIIITFLLAFGLTIFAQQSVIQGKWERRGVNEISLFAANNGQLEKLETREITGANKDFTFTFTPKQAGFYVVGAHSEFTPTGKYVFYFKPGDNLNLIVNDSSYTLVGENTKENIALTAWNDYILRVQLNALYATMMTYVDFFPLLDEKLDGLETWRTNFLKPTGNKTFDETFARFRHYDLLSYATSFATKPAGATPQGEDFSDFYAEVKLDDLLANMNILDYPHASRMLITVSNVETMVSGERPRSRMQMIDAAKNDTLKGELFLLYLSGSARDMAALEIWKEKYEKYLFTAEQKARLQEIIDRMQQRPEQAQTARPVREERTEVAAGALAPAFTYKDVNGNSVSLSDFKGKVVYIDIWATWCGPCRAEIPHLKRLKESYKNNKDLVIIGISTDAIRDIEKWKDFVATNELGGIQLHGRTDNDDDIAKLYGVRGIPHFVLIDKQGKIVSGKAPRPSSDELVPMIEKLLK
jgi:thiol-disulfide isomerase/thioredoxin